MMRMLILPLAIMLLVAGCSSRPEKHVLRAGGVQVGITCRTATGVERTSFCGMVLPRDEADSVINYLRLTPLKTPAKHGKVTNIIELPLQCRILLFDNPAPMVLYGVFDSPYQLNDRQSKVQFTSVVLARSNFTDQSCFTFVRDFN